MVSAVVAGPGAVGTRALQLEVLLEVGGRLPSHLLESARSELVVRPPLCSFLLLPADIERSVRGETETLHSPQCQLDNAIS